MAVARLVLLFLAIFSRSNSSSRGDSTERGEGVKVVVKSAGLVLLASEDPRRWWLLPLDDDGGGEGVAREMEISGTVSLSLVLTLLLLGAPWDRERRR